MDENPYKSPMTPHKVRPKSKSLLWIFLIVATPILVIAVSFALHVVLRN